jgi:hypothetical protein
LHDQAAHGLEKVRTSILRVGERTRYTPWRSAIVRIAAASSLPFAISSAAKSSTKFMSSRALTFWAKTMKASSSSFGQQPSARFAVFAKEHSLVLSRVLPYGLGDKRLFGEGLSLRIDETARLEQSDLDGEPGRGRRGDRPSTLVLEGPDRHPRRHPGDGRSAGIHHRGRSQVGCHDRPDYRLPP